MKQVNILSNMVQDQNLWKYRNGPKYLKTKIWANSVDPEQTAPEGTV